MTLYAIQDKSERDSARGSRSRDGDLEPLGDDDLTLFAAIGTLEHEPSFELTDDPASENLRDLFRDKGRKAF